MECAGGLVQQDGNWGEMMLERLLKAYQRHFDIQRGARLGGTVLPALAEFHSRGEKYVLVKKAKLWGVENHEYVAFFIADVLTPELLGEITTLLRDAEPQLVKPHSEHMYTYLSAVVLTKELPQEAAKLLKRYKWRKSYLFSLQGWCHLRLAAVDTVTGKVITNADGREMRRLAKLVSV